MIAIHNATQLPAASESNITAVNLLRITTAIMPEKSVPQSMASAIRLDHTILILTVER
jgi:hypothetical protein